MNKKFSGWICLVAVALYVCELSVVRTWAQQLGDQNATIAGTKDPGQFIPPPPPPEEESSLWKWVGGAVVVAAAAVAAYFAAEESNSDGEDAADDAAAIAAAAADEAAATTEAVAEAAEMAAVAAQEAEAAAEAAANPAGFEFSMLITGQFKGGSSICSADNTKSFTPSIEFTLSPDPAGLPGGVSRYASSDDCGLTEEKGGFYEQIDDAAVLIRLDDGFYLGRADYLARNKLKLANGAVLTAQPGATIRLEPIPVR